MAGANSNFQITDLDFSSIKNNLKNFLKSQDTLKDYNYEGAALSTLLDVLAYNTQYNAYYLNMVANEMFLDTAIQRNSVVSHAKLLDYVPKSASAPEAKVNLQFTGVTDSSLTIPKFTQFLSEAIDGINYTFVTVDNKTVNANNNVVMFENLSLRQGIPTTYTYLVDGSLSQQKFTIPETTIDTTSLVVSVQESSSNAYTQVYTAAEDYLTLDSGSLIYFLQEGLNGQYEIYFGNGILGKTLSDGNIVIVSYITTSGSAASGANNFTLMNSINGYSAYSLTPVIAASAGANKETIESIKFQAPKKYAAQKRAVTKDDYITAIQNNKLNYEFDGVSVWGGEENENPVYGQVFIALKPKGAYTLTNTQKERLIVDVINPISVLTVTPTIVDPDYTYFQITADVLYDTKKTNLTANQISDKIKLSIQNLAANSLNSFNSTFVYTDFSDAIRSSDSSIITNQIKIQLQKKFYPSLTTPTTYTLYYGAPLQKGFNISNIYSLPAMQFKDPVTPANTIDGVYLEEVPPTTGGIESISVLNPGFSYKYTPTVTISGDGTGATAVATINTNGSITKIDVVNKGTGYTSALITITPQSNDTTGLLGAGVAMLEGRYGIIRSYYNNTKGVKTILNKSVGTIDYIKGIIVLNSFNPLQVDNPLGQLTIATTPTTSIISSTYNRVITVDTFDPNAINVNVTAK
jgi:hypothetical protein